MENTNTQSDNLSNMEDGNRKKYLTFTLCNEKYGIPLSSVKEIIGITDTTPVPQVPSYFKGLINLRGKIISIIELRKKLKISSEQTLERQKTSIVITEVGDTLIGSVVDDVNEVIGLHPDQIQPTSNIQSRVSHELITGVARVENSRLILLLDIEKVLDLKELEEIKNKVKKAI